MRKMYTMSIQNKDKLQNLLQTWPQGVVATTQWIMSKGISRSLIEKYKANGWISSLDVGAYYKPQDKIEWFGALHALQFQLNTSIHIGGKSALEFQGHGHFVALGRPRVDLLKAPGSYIPKWFSRYKWPEDLRITQSNLFPPLMEQEELLIQNIAVLVSSRERATLELLHMAPLLYDFEDVRILMESLGTLRPAILNELFQRCSSEKAKRLLLYFGDVQGHSWRKHIDDKAKVSSYLLKIVNRGGGYNAKYNLFLPREYVIKNEQDVRF
jgi:hypothetical protein